MTATTRHAITVAMARQQDPWSAAIDGHECDARRYTDGSYHRPGSPAAGSPG